MNSTFTQLVERRLCESAGCRFVTDCVSCDDVEALEDMIDNSDEITYEEFMSHVSPEDVASFFPDYDWYDQGGLTLKGDYHVRYHKSYYQGNPAVFIVHSAIEYVWVCERHV